MTIKAEHFRKLEQALFENVGVKFYFDDTSSGRSDSIYCVLQFEGMISPRDMQMRATLVGGGNSIATYEKLALAELKIMDLLSPDGMASDEWIWFNQNRTLAFLISDLEKNGSINEDVYERNFTVTYRINEE